MPYSPEFQKIADAINAQCAMESKQRREAAEQKDYERVMAGETVSYSEAVGWMNDRDEDGNQLELTDEQRKFLDQESTRAANEFVKRYKEKHPGVKCEIATFIHAVEGRPDPITNGTYWGYQAKITKE